MGLERRFIESVRFPFQEVSEASAVEKGAGRPPHWEMVFWWTRKPLISARAVIAGCLLPENTNPADFLHSIGIVVRERRSDGKPVFERTPHRVKSRLRFDGVKLLDPFACFGLIPLEGLRLGLSVTVSDPNFNTIEDRMLCRLHRLTKEKYSELAKSQRNLMLGILQSKMVKTAPKLRDHLTLVYAIQTRHPIVVEAFQEKKVMLTSEMFNLLERASDLILECLEAKTVPFSMRLERRAIQLASALSLTNYFNVVSDIIPIDSMAAKMAVQFFVEEAWIRANEAFPLYEVLKKLALGG